MEPREWDVSAVLRDPDLAARAAALPARDRYALIERLADRPGLTLVAAHAGAADRAPPAGSALRNATLALNPQAALATRRRTLAAGSVAEATQVQVRNQMPLALSALQAALAAALDRPRSGEELVGIVCEATGAAAQAVSAAVEELLSAEVLYAPRAPA
jgi:hypothetical protein